MSIMRVLIPCLLAVAVVQAIPDCIDPISGAPYYAGQAWPGDCKTCMCHQGGGISCVPQSCSSMQCGFGTDLYSHPLQAGECCPQLECQDKPGYLKEIIVEVAAKSNAQAASAHCAIDYSGNAKGSEQNFAPIGSSFAYGQNVSFSGGVVLGAGDVKNLRLKCGSEQQDALQVVKLYVKEGDKVYVGAVDAVFDDSDSCNVNLVSGINVCVEDKDVVLAEA